MSRFIYRHFGADCPKEVEREYNRCLRYEKYLQERDLEHGLFSYDTKKIPEIIDRTTTQEYQRETEYEELWECRKAILPSALEWLKENRPYEYGLIQEYFFSEGISPDTKITLNVLAKKIWCLCNVDKAFSEKGTAAFEDIHYSERTTRLTFVQNIENRIFTKISVLTSVKNRNSSVDIIEGTDR